MPELYDVAAIGNAIVISESGTGFAFTGAATRLAGGVGQIQDLIGTQLALVENMFQVNSQVGAWVDAMQADLAL